MRFTAYPRGTVLLVAIAAVAVLAWIVGFDTVREWVPESVPGRAGLVLVVLVVGVKLYGIDPFEVAASAIQAASSMVG